MRLLLLSHGFKWNNGQREGINMNPLFAFLVSFFTPCCVVVLVVVCISFFPPLLSGYIWIGTVRTACVQIGPPPYSLCWLTQVSPCPWMPLHPQQSSAFGLQLPETVPELLCLCSHTHLHWYAEAGKEVGAGKRVEVWQIRRNRWWWRKKS